MLPHLLCIRGSVLLPCKTEDYCSVEYPMSSVPNKSLQRTAIPLHFIAAGELSR